MGRKQVRIARRKAAFKKAVVKERETDPSQSITHVRNPEKRPWTPFQDVTNQAVNPMCASLGLDRAAVMHKLFGDSPCQLYKNSHYVVQKRTLRTQSGKDYYQLSLRTVENDARHDWRELQRIKNELCGPEFEAVEIYPAESRLVDSSNQFFLWVLPADERVMLGFEDRLVMETSAYGTRQRPFRKDQRPADLVSQEEYEDRLRRLATSKEDHARESKTKEVVTEDESAAVRGTADHGGAESGPVPVCGATGNSLQGEDHVSQAGANQDPADPACEEVAGAGPGDRGPSREPITKHGGGREESNGCSEGQAGTAVFQEP